MTGRRAAVGLSLFCALLFCAFAAQGASAAKGTTAFTCVPVTKGAEFKDAHCDTAGTGEGFKHEEIPPITPPGTEVGTEITGSNTRTAEETKKATNAVLTSGLLGITVKIECEAVHSEGKLNNTEEAGKMHAGGHVTISYTKCKVAEPAGCKVKEPIVAKAQGKTVVLNEEAGKEEMGVEFSPTEAGKPFVEVTLETCGLLNGKHAINGSVIGTPGNAPNGKGATLYFANNVKGQVAMQKLTFAGEPATYIGVETVEMKEPTATTGHAITLTTTKN